MHTCHYRNELVGAVHGCTKCRLKSNHEIAGVSPYHSSSSLPPTHPLSSASPPSPLFSYSATPLLPSLSLALVLRRFSFLVRSLARSPACLLACLLPGEFKYPCLTELRVCDTRRPCSDIGWREDTCVRILDTCGWSFALKNRETRSRLNTLPRSRRRWEGLFGGELHRMELGYSR